MNNDKRLLSSQTKVIKDFFNKAGPISYDTASKIVACLGFRMIPKLINNRLVSVPDKLTFADWVGFWTTSATGLLAISYGGSPGFRYWLVVQGIGNTVGTVLYSVA